METVREFRVETNSLQRRVRPERCGGQINAITKSGTNQFGGSAFEYHRNDALDARNYFDVAAKARLHAQSVRRHGRRPPDSTRSALLFRAATRRLREQLGQDDCRRPCPTTTRGSASFRPARSRSIPRSQPYLDEFPRANGENLGGGLAVYTFPFEQRLDQHFVQGRLDAAPDQARSSSSRYTFDDTDQTLPTDYPQFPRAFVSRNQFMTGEYRKVLSSATVAHGAARLQPHAHRPDGRGEHVATAAGLRPRAPDAWAPSTSAASRASVTQSLGGRAAACRTCSASSTTSPGLARPAPHQEPARSSSTTRTTSSTRRSAWASSASPT